jgi:hypothetical protein
MAWSWGGKNWRLNILYVLKGSPQIGSIKDEIIAQQAKGLRKFCFAGQFFKHEVPKTCTNYIGDFD